jgi:hypothetical protein
MKNLPVILLLVLLTVGCNFSKSVKLDLLTGLTTKGDGISCEDVRIYTGNGTVSTNTFNYGEVINIDFSQLQGLKMENDRFFPGMELYVTNSAGDTILGNKDMYSQYDNGIKLSPLVLSANITAAKPVVSGGEYKLYIRIWDKKGKGTFTALFKFNVVKNQKINILTSAGASCGEIYLFSKESGRVINDNKVKVNEDVYLLFEGLSGFTETGGKVFPGISMKASGADGEVLMDHEDLFSDYSATGIDLPVFEKQVMTNFNFKTDEIKNPVSIKVTIWDKKGDAKVIVSTELVVEK